MQRTRFLFSFRRFSTSGGAENVVDWSVAGKILTVEQKQFYRDNGYLLMKNCVKKEELKKFTDRFNAICERKVKLAPTVLVMKDVSIAKKAVKANVDTITKLQDFGEEPVLFSYCELPKITTIVRDLIGNPTSNLQAMHSMLINKPPDSGKLTSRHPMHQDHLYFPWGPVDLTVCAWTAMEKINAENGCLQLVPGTHKLGLKEHAYPDWEGGVNTAYYAIKNYDMSLKREYVEMEAGDTVFFHPWLFHGSGVNRSKGFRKAISCHYANYDHSKYYDVTGTVQEELGKQLTEVFAKRPDRYKIPEGQKMTLELAWRVRSRPVGHNGRENL